jgi:hypothetical protein
MQAVAMLTELNRTSGRKVPDSALDGFVPTRFRDYLSKARQSGDDTAYRHYWELCVLLGLRDGLRSGDVHVPGSRRYADPGTTCSPRSSGRRGRRSSARWSANPPTAGRHALEQGVEELHVAMAELETVLARSSPDDVGAVRLDTEGRLVIPPLTAEDVPPRPRR